MQYRFLILSFLLIISCVGPDREDIVFDDFEKGQFINWEKQGESFKSPVHVDSIKTTSIENIHGRFLVFSNFEGEGESRSQGKLVSKKFEVERRYINFLIAGGKHETRECVNLIIDNEIVRTATGENNFLLSPVIWDVHEFEGKKAIIEIVDAVIQDYQEESLGYILADYFVFSDNKHRKEVVFEDFESGTYNNWIVEGDAFKIPRNRTNIYYPLSANGFKGEFFAFSFGSNHDIKQGKLTSEPFMVHHDYVKLLVGGGSHKTLTCVNFIIDDEIVFTATGNDDGKLRPHQWDVSAFKGKMATIKILDQHSGSWGHIMVDDIVFVNKNPWYLKPIYYGLSLLLGILIYVFFKFIQKSKFRKTNTEVENEKLKVLREIIKSSKGYLDADFSVKDIVETSNMSLIEIKEILETNKYFSFTDYVNVLRIEEFKTRINDPKNEIYTTISIAKQCGFKSKTSFYRVFKQVTNQTPSEYKKES